MIAKVKMVQSSHTHRYRQLGVDKNCTVNGIKFRFLRPRLFGEGSNKDFHYCPLLSGNRLNQTEPEIFHIRRVRWLLKFLDLIF
jgi:hypothetical protein